MKLPLHSQATPFYGTLTVIQNAFACWEVKCPYPVSKERRYGISSVRHKAGVLGKEEEEFENKQNDTHVAL